jgi:regulator of ribosome biosynthesis
MHAVPTVASWSTSDNVEDYLQTLAQQGVQALLGTLFSLPTASTPDGPLAQLPPVVTLLPRSKPLPKPKPPTKWERFAAAKGITKTKRERKVWDEERQEWVNRWGRDGKNKQEEAQWLTEVKANADVDHDPSKAARDARKARVAKNERQRLQNDARSQRPSGDREQRKVDINHTLASTRVSTASMGRFDKKLEGEKKMKGVKRKVSLPEYVDLLHG